jgi:hypothetical protein
LGKASYSGERTGLRLFASALRRKMGLASVLEFE